MRLGGFVIHGNASETLEACLRSLSAVCDELVAVDSGSTDGSASIVASAGVRAVHRKWAGYGAARAAAVAALPGCSHLFFLDADERLEAAAIETLRAFKASDPQLPAYRLEVRDWVELPGGRFVYRRHHRTRLFRYEKASWTPEMIVHEALGVAGSGRLDAAIEHRFLSSVEQRSAKNDVYALLWAVQAHAAGKASKPAALQRPAHLFKDLAMNGAIFRGGLPAVRIASHVSRYHSAKYDYLRRIRAGEFSELCTAYREGRFEQLFASVAELMRGNGSR